MSKVVCMFAFFYLKEKKKEKEQASLGLHEYELFVLLVLRAIRCMLSYMPVKQGSSTILLSRLPFKVVFHHKPFLSSSYTNH